MQETRAALTTEGPLVRLNRHVASDIKWIESESLNPFNAYKLTPWKDK